MLPAGHPNTRLFITHCGVHSKMEAAFHGVPIISVPFQFEQAGNCLSLVSLGMGEVCRQAVAYRIGRNKGVRFERSALVGLVRQVCGRLRRQSGLHSLPLKVLRLQTKGLQVMAYCS